ncbi:alpha/beta hydrolase [Geodermatophilus aquaeductus]|uniref:Pimeloyl-ACP methyl ester carboxylesterase n=1 Tax=Geodermatophilus aquaeductus TaxID=1564161 RepID=A0A521DRT2_9ACTN|nr:alpha/beta hydrolase [Geodermatophilus aquaeductus]SMO73580.1 Pimeloyl-ACP methyl ester carboxylesterase [Geodermatophilus aquaeductus]
MATYTAADGAVLHADVLGRDDGPTLLVLADGAAAHPAYLGDLAGMGERYRLVVPHMRGVGRSRDAPLASRWDQADDVDRLRAALGLDRCTLVAHSAGTRLAVAHAARFPGRLAAQVLVTPPAEYLVDVPSDAAALLAARAQEPAVAAALAALEEEPDLTDDDTFTAWRVRSAALGYARWDATTQAHARGMRYAVAAARTYMAGETPADLHERLRAVTAPTLVVAGERDVSTGVAPVLAVAGLFARGEAVVVEGSGHFPFVEQPAAFRAAVDPFLARVLA